MELILPLLYVRRKLFQHHSLKRKQESQEPKKLKVCQSLFSLFNQSVLIGLDIPIREPSPLPIIDRSKHYSTRFSTRKKN
jgi:hypothetical protein